MFYSIINAQTMVTVMCFYRNHKWFHQFLSHTERDFALKDVFVATFELFQDVLSCPGVKFVMYLNQNWILPLKARLSTQRQTSAVCRFFLFLRELMLKQNNVVKRVNDVQKISRLVRVQEITKIWTVFLLKEDAIIEIKSLN